MNLAKERAIELFNQNIKLCVYLSKEMKIIECRELCLNNVLAIKQCLYELSLKAGLNKYIKEQFNFYEQVKVEIEKFNSYEREDT
jgi:hypothetical protein